MSKLPHIFLLGATGYLGGSVFSALLPNNNTKYTISALVRSPEKAQWLEAHAVRPVLGNLNDTALIQEEAANANILIKTADSDHLPSARAAVEGLKTRHAHAGRKSLYLHTSGTGILISPTHTFGAAPLPSNDLIYRDDDEAALAAIPTTHLHRETDVFLLSPAHTDSLHLTIVAPSAIHGQGLGDPALANILSVQIPWLVAQAMKLGRMHMVGAGENWSCQVHVRDLVAFYVNLLDIFLGEDKGGEQGRKTLPHGYVFPVPAPTGGEVQMRELVHAVAREMMMQGFLDSDEVVAVEPSDEGLKRVFGSSAGKWLVGGNCRGRGLKAAATGWVAKEDGVLRVEGLRETVGEVGRAVREGRYKGFGEGGKRSDERYKD